MFPVAKLNYFSKFGFKGFEEGKNFGLSVWKNLYFKFFVVFSGLKDVGKTLSHKFKNTST